LSEYYAKNTITYKIITKGLSHVQLKLRLYL
jgi:hypothetical protein